MRLYDVEKNVELSKYDHRAAILEGTFIDSAKVVFGGLDSELLLLDFEKNTTQTVGGHEKPIRCVAFSGSHQCVASGSWDCCVSLWDIKSSSKIFHQKFDGKIYAMDISPDGNKLVVGTSGRQVFIIDVRKNGKLLQERESSLNFQTRCIRCNTDNDGYLLSSIEGRASVEYFDPSPEAQSRKYAFKCHRSVDHESKIQSLFPVNALAFHPRYGTFVTGGCDGYVSFWDGKNRKRIANCGKYPASIASLSFNIDGSLLAIASSYTFENGDVMPPAADEIFIKNADAEAQPKKKK